MSDAPLQVDSTPLGNTQKLGPVASAVAGILALILGVFALIILGNVVVFLLGLLCIVGMVVIPLGLIAVAVALSISSLRKTFT